MSDTDELYVKIELQRQGRGANFEGCCERNFGPILTLNDLGFKTLNQTLNSRAAFKKPKTRMVATSELETDRQREIFN